MVDINAILGNYINKRHFLQNVNIPVSGTPFVYMKNHKAACTTVLATLLAHLLDMRGEGTERINMNSVHAPPRTLLLTGLRSLNVPQVKRALEDPAAFRFTVVRDPLSRTVSSFADKILKADIQKNFLMRYLRRPMDSDITLSEFLDILANDAGALNVDRHWRPQRKEICYDHIDYHFIGDTADLSGAIAHIVKRIFDSDEPIMQDTRKTLGHTSHSHELIEGLTAQDRRNIEKALEQDFEMYEEVRKSPAETA